MACRRYFQKGSVLPLEYCWPPMHGLPGWLLVHKVPYLTNDALADTQIVHELCVRFGVRSALSTPILTAAGDVLGFFEIHNKQDGGFTPADRELLLSVSQSAAVALQNALAYRTIRQAEEALRESEQRFRQLADAMPQIVWTAGPDGQIDYLNRRWTEFTGLPETVGNDGWGPLLHPDEARPAGERWAASVASRRAVRDGAPAAGPAAADLPLAPHPDRGRPRRGGQRRPLVRDRHRHPRAEAGRGVLPLPGRGQRRPGGRGGLREHLAEGGEPGRPVLRRLVRRGRGRATAAACGGWRSPTRTPTRSGSRTS